jgi:hypothetical protein
MPLEVGRSNIDNIAIAIQPPMNVSGSFKIDGQTTPTPLSGIQVTLQARDGGDRMSGPNPTGKVSDDASFRLANVNADRYTLKVTGLPDGFYVKAVRTGNQEVLLSGLDFSKGTASPIEVMLSPNAGQVTGLVQNDQQQPAAGVSVVLIPQEPEKRDQLQYYKVVTTDDTGHFTLKNLDPGQYKAFAWQDIESGAYLDPDFVRPVENRGEPVSIREGSLETIQVKLIT